MNGVRQPQNSKTVSGYTMVYLGLKKPSGYTNMIAMLTVTVCIKLQWAQPQAHPLWAVQHQPNITSGSYSYAVKFGVVQHHRGRRRVNMTNTDIDVQQVLFIC